MQVRCWPEASPASGALAEVNNEARGLRLETSLHLLPSAWSGGQDPMHAFSPRSSPSAVA